MWRIPLALLAGALTVVALSLAPSAPSTRAAFPGANGKIAFESDRDGNSEIYVVNADGSGQTNLTNSPSQDTTPVWSPDGTKIAFTSDRDGNKEVYVMDAEGRGQRNLTNNTGDDYSPVWSPDGLKIAFTTNRDDINPTDCFPCNFEVYVMNADGTDQTNLTNAEWPDYVGSWSPDGRTVAFVRDLARAHVEGVSLSEGMNIHLASADGSGTVQVTFWEEALVGPPVWSPDGSRIAFNAYHHFRTSPDVWVLRVDDNSVERLSHSGYDIGPQWSHDSSEILFHTGVYTVGDIHLMDADGTDQRNLTNTPANDSSPRWSPDGSMIVFVGERDGNRDIHVMSADGSERTRITDDPLSDSSPDWQPVRRVGNTNCQGGVDAVDAVLILQFSAGLLDVLPCADAADVDDDGIVNPLDAALILQFVAGLIGSLPP